jgi:DNA ligase 1
MSLFSQLAQVGDQLAATKKKLEHRAIIASYLKSLPPDEIAIAARLLIARVFPENDPRILNLSGSAVNRVLERICGTELEWSKIGGAVDYGQAVEKWLLLYAHETRGEPLTLDEIYRAYESIAQDVGPGSRERKDARLVGLFSRATPREAKYIVKHLIREMRVGVSEGTLLDGIAAACGIDVKLIRRANQVTGDVGEVARVALTEGAVGLGHTSVRIGMPLKPMLAQTAEDVKDAFETLGGARFALEYKFDGARVQIHKRGDEIKLFSRQLSDITGSLPEIAAACRAIRANDAILEGEVIALTAEGRPRPFQDVMRRFGREREVERLRGEVPVKLYLFDLLLLENQPLIDEPNETRWQKLLEVRDGLECAERVVPSNVEEGETFLRRAREAGHEGLMAKHLASPYVPGERGAHWLKIKPVITLDLVIVAADWGYGRRTGWLSNMHLAARDAESGEFMEVGKTFKGMTDVEFKSLTEQLQAIKIKESHGTVWVEPRIVVEVAFNNVQRSPRYPSGVALRLARVVNFRPDKSAGEIETVQRLRELM